MECPKGFINELGCKRFADDTGQELTDFYSIDLQTGYDESGQPTKKLRKGSKKRKVTTWNQEEMWNASPCTSDHVAGKLSLCLGMPIMIRNNEATELCITKGQEGLISGWESSIGSHGKTILDTLYVKLISPPKNIQVPHLPPNVVPIPRSSTYVTCLMDDGGKIGVRRQQVLVLPNFAMTDYASQGKTRPLNVVDFTHCKNHSILLHCFITRF